MKKVVKGGATEQYFRKHNLHTEKNQEEGDQNLDSLIEEDKNHELRNSFYQEESNQFSTKHGVLDSGCPKNVMGNERFAKYKDAEIKEGRKEPFTVSKHK